MARTGGLAALAVTVVLAWAPSALATAGIAVSDANFGNVAVASSSTLTVTVLNPGSSDLQVDGFSLTGTSASQFSVTTDNCAPYPRTLATSGSCTYQVTFQPFSRGVKTANLVVANSAAGGDNTASLSGAGIAPVVGVPTAVSFGEARVGTTGVTRNVTISNTTTDAGQVLYVTSASTAGAAAGDFTTDGGDCMPFPKAVAPGNSCTLTVRFAPPATGARNATLQVATNDPVNPTKDIPLSGTGTNQALAFTPASLSFGEQLVATSSSPKGLTLTNIGTVGDVVLSSIGVAGANAADFPLESNSCAPPKTLGPGESCTLGLRFAPSTAEARSASIHVVSDLGENSASLAGTGTAPPPAAENGLSPTTDTGASLTADTGGSTPPPTTTAPPDSSPAAVSCVVPKLKGKTLALAKLALRRAHCRLGKVTRVRSSRRPGRVLRQSIRAGARRPAGTRVALVLARR